MEQEVDITEQMAAAREGIDNNIPDQPKEPEAPAPLPKGSLTPEEYQNRVERLRSMGRAIGSDFGMKVEVGTQPGWRYKFKPVNTIEVDPNDVGEKGLEYCFGVIAHEGAHRKISQVDFVPKKVWQTRGFSFLMNAVEDPRVNNWVSNSYDGANEWIEGMYNQDMSTEDKVTDVAQQKVGYTPKHIRFGLETIRYWHTGRFSPNLPPEIQEALNKTIQYSEMAYQTLPTPHNPNEDDVEQNALRSYKIIYSAIWPEYMKLVEKSMDDEEKRQMIKDMIENGEIDLEPGEGQGEGGEPLPLDDLPDDLKEKLKQKIKEKLDSMSEEERKKYEEEMKKRAGKNMDELETAENETLKGEFSDQPETKDEEERRKEREEAAEKGTQDLQSLKEEMEKKLAENRTEYDKAYLEVQPYVEKVAEDIINLFAQHRWPQFKVGFPGQRLRLKGAMDWEARNDYTKLFERREREERKNYAFTILVDLSGSMSGQKINETFKGVVMFVEALNKVASVMGDIQVSVYGFQDELIEYVKFDERLDDSLRQKMSVMKAETANKGIHNHGGNNNDGYCLDGASKILDQVDATERFLFVLSDGQPASDSKHHLPGFSSENDEEELRHVIKNISSGGRVKLLGVGLGPGTEHVTDYYSTELPNVENAQVKKIPQLVDLFTKKLGELIK